MKALEAGGGGGGGSSSRGLRVIAVNDGLPVFESINEVPDTITLTVQTDATIHAPVTVRLRGQETQAGTAVTIGTRGDTAISPGVTERVTFPISTAQKDLIENAAQSHSGTADIAIFGASEQRGTATRQATFAIYIKNSLASMIGPINRNEILVNGLPALIPNIIQTVLANLQARHRAVQIFGGVGNPSVVRADNVQMSEASWEEYKRADWLYIYIGDSVRSVALTDINGSMADHFRVPLEAMDRTTGHLYYRDHFTRQRAINTDYVNIEIFERRITVTPVNITGIGSNFLSVVAYVPTYSFVPAPAVKSFADFNFLGSSPASTVTNAIRHPEFTARPSGRYQWFSKIGAVEGVEYADTSGEVDIIVLEFSGNRFYPTLAWLFSTPGEYRIKTTKAGTVDNRLFSLLRYTNNVQTVLATTRTNTESIDETVTVSAGDILAIGSQTSGTAAGSMRVEITQPPTLPGYTAP